MAIRHVRAISGGGGKWLNRSYTEGRSGGDYAIAQRGGYPRLVGHYFPRTSDRSHPLPLTAPAVVESALVHYKSVRRFSMRLSIVIREARR